MNEPSPAPNADNEPELIWRFANVRYDAGSRSVAIDGNALTLERKPVEVLDYLLRHAGEVVTKEELAEAIWTRRVIDDAVITKAVGKLRKELGPAGREAIRTVHGLGYQLVADVEVSSLGAARVNTVVGVAPGDQPPGRENWRLVRALGSGGYGEAWLSQHRTTGEQRVLKFARDRAGLSALKREVTLCRLLRETLGQHPGIQGLLDWNLTTPPFFVESEYLPAGSLAEWAAADGRLSKLPLANRLELVAAVAEALSAAHGVGVLHKDLKPSNILIAEGEHGPIPRLTDFGVGEVIDSARLEELRITQHGFSRELDRAGSPVGSLMYMAPELIAGQPSTIRADVYALGVLLFQLVRGEVQLPLAPGWQRLIDDELLCEDIAACVDGDPARRLADAAELARRLRELPTRRTARQAAQTSAERDRELRAQMARLRQRRTLLASISIVLLVGLATSLTFYSRARQASADAARQAQVAETINAFVVDDLLSRANPEVSGRRDLSLRELVDTAAERSAERFADNPLLEGSLRISLGRIYRGLGAQDAALAELARAVERLATAPRELAQARLVLGETLNQASEFDAAIATLTLVADDAEAPLEQRLQARIEIALAQARLGELQAATQALNALIPEIPPSDKVLRALAHERLGDVLYLAGADLPGTVAATEVAAALYLEHFGPRHLNTLRLTISRGMLLFELNEYEQAQEVLTAALATAQAALGPAHLESLRAQGMLARTLNAQGRHAEAESELRELLPIAVASYGEKHLWSRIARNDLANVLRDTGSHDEALEHYYALIAINREKIGAERYQQHDSRFRSLRNIAVTLNNAERWSEAAELLRPALVDAQAALGPEHYLPHRMALTLATALSHLGRPAAEVLPLLDAPLAYFAAPGTANPTLLDQAVTLREQVQDGSPATRP